VPLFVAELAGCALADNARDATDASACLTAHGVSWLEGLEGVRGERRIWLFEAADAESVRHALRAARAPLERVWPAIRTDRQNVPENTRPPGATETRPVFSLLDPAAASESSAKVTVK